MTDAASLAVFDALAQADLVRSGEASPLELVEAAIARIEALDPTLNAVVATAFDRAVDSAASVPTNDGRPFPGVPFLLKDLITEADGLGFTEGSRFLRDNVSTHDPELVTRLKAAGFVILGKTNTPEFGMAPTASPASTDPRAIPGTSSGPPPARAAARVPPSPRGWCRPPTPTTSGARSANPARTSSNPSHGHCGTWAGPSRLPAGAGPPVGRAPPAGARLRDVPRDRAAVPVTRLRPRPFSTRRTPCPTILRTPWP